MIKAKDSKSNTKDSESTSKDSKSIHKIQLSPTLEPSDTNNFKRYIDEFYNNDFINSVLPIEKE
tara:strand:+ start:506 stop:697 length:192 start_codon:yes stop_codon:yes gene_type:complete